MAQNDDATGLVGVRVSDGQPIVLHCREKPDGPEGAGWQVDRVEADLAVRHAFDTYDVAAFFADVREFESYIDTWGQDFGDRLLIDAVQGRTRHPVAWDMRPTSGSSPKPLPAPAPTSARRP